MARYLFGYTPGDFVVNLAGATLAPKPNAAGTVWSAKTGGTQHTDLLAADGTTPITAVTSESDGRVGFYGPAGIVSCWVDFGGGRYRMTATATYPDGTPVSVAARPVVVDVRDKGATGDGVTDDTQAIKDAIDAAGPHGVVHFPAGTYLITDTLVSGAALGWAWTGERDESGCNALGTSVGASYSASRIKFRPVDTTKPLVRVYDTAHPSSAIGPFTHRDLTFDIGAANGPVFGVEDPDDPTTLRPASPPTVTDAVGQAYVFGVSFEHCAFDADWAVRTSTGGVIVRAGRQSLSMAKCFEARVHDTTFKGGDTQIRMFGCDRPIVSEFRSQGSHLPFDVEGSGSFAAQHLFEGLQVEGWTFTPIRSRGVEIAAIALRLEQFYSSDYVGRFALPGTFSVTAGSATLTATTSMTNVLFPGLSLVEFTAGGYLHRALVTAVAGTSVTIDAATTVLATASGLTVTRVHGVGPVHSGTYAATYAHASPYASLNCPSFVWLVSRGDMVISDAIAVPGSGGDNVAWAIGNHHGSQYNTSGVMRFDGCSPMLCPDPSSPFVSVTGSSAPYGNVRSDFPNNRPRFGSIAESSAVVSRRWVFTTKNAANYGNSYLHPIVELADDANTTQKVWAWLKNASPTYLALHDPTVPSTSGRYVRVRIRARSVASTGSLGWCFAGNATSSTNTVSLTDSFQTFESVVALPAAWQGSRAVGVEGFLFTGSGYYLAGVTVEELTPPTVTGSRGGNAALASLLAVGAAQGLFIDNTTA